MRLRRRTVLQQAAVLAGPRLASLAARWPLALVPSDFRLNGQTRLTARELEVLTALARQDRVTGEKTAAYVSALNNKFIRCKVPLGIRYEQNRGYRLVTEHE